MWQLKKKLLRTWQNNYNVQYITEINKTSDGNKNKPHLTKHTPFSVTQPSFILVISWFT